MSLEKFIENQKKSIESLTTLFSNYYSKLEPSGITSKKVSNILIIDNNLKQLRVSSSLLDIPTDDKSLIISYVNLSKYYKYLDEIYHTLKSFQLIDDKEKSVGKTITSSMIKELSEMWEEIELFYSDFLLVTEITEHIYTLTYLKKDLDSNRLESLITNFSPQAIHLYVYILNRTLLKYPQLKEKMLKWIEDMKVSILYNKDAIFPKINNINVIQFLVQTLHHSPQGPSKPFNEIIKDLEKLKNEKKGGLDISEYLEWSGLPRDSTIFKRNKKIGSSEGLNPTMIEKKLKELSSLWSTPTVKYGFAVIYKLTKKPIEYNLYSIHNKLIKTWIGINEKLVEDTKTIYELPAFHTRETIIIIRENLEKGKKNILFILETLNGVHFRILESGDETFSILPETNPSVKLGYYNDIMRKEIEHYFKDPLITAEELERQETSYNENYWNNLRREVLKNTLDTPLEGNDILSYLREKLKYIGKNITYYIHFELFKRNISNLPETARNYVNKEIFLSYLDEINSINRGFLRDVENLYNKEYKNKIDTSNKIRAMEVINTMLLEVLERYLENRSNIYIIIENKFNLLMKIFI